MRVANKVPISRTVNKPKDILDFYYIAPVANLESILRRGVLSHAVVERKSLQTDAVYDSSIVARRGERRTPDGKALWDFANFYFNPRNAILYRVHRAERRDVVVLLMRRQLLDSGKYISVGNAASQQSKILPVKEGLVKIQSDAVMEKLRANVWNEDEGKRLMMSELLVPDSAAPGYIQSIYVPTAEKAKEVRNLLELPPGVDAIPHPDMFFGMAREIALSGTKIKIVDGDMFFSRMQTLTVSVNTRGVMGKGLAARTKYAVPDVYVKYEDLCKTRKLTTARPCLVKREKSLDEQFADDFPSLNVKPNANRWFLLFATKDNWRQPSRMEYIEDGLKWLVANASREGITSLALPALGCGLGWLRWADVAPLMCRYLRRLDIPCEIYLPREGEKIPDAQLSGKFLLDDRTERGGRAGSGHLFK